MTFSTRLEQALQLVLTARARGEDPKRLITDHPELADLIEPMCDDDADGAIPEIGEVLGDFTLGREVGRGGMGIVYEARQSSLDRRVALKVLAHEVATSPTQLARFHREARTLARLDHPHIVRVLDVGQNAGRHWLAMEFIDGESLDHRLAGLRDAGGHSGASRRALVETIADIADALQHVHDAGILHRDVKPSNVLLHRDGRALLSDFGLARDTSAPSLTQIGVVAGTPHYMSPEHLIGGEALSAASDVFSLGATLYECVTLQRPFDGQTTEHVLGAILKTDPLDPRRHDRTLSRDLGAIILKSLEKQPHLRYPTARALADDLRAFLELRAVAARPHSPWQRLRRFARREPMRAGLTAALALVAVLTVIVLTLLPTVRRAQAARDEQAYEEAITAGDLARHAGDRDTSMREFAAARALFPQRSEAIVWQCLAISELETAEAALAQLEHVFGTSSTDEVVERLRAYLLTQVGRRDEAFALDVRLGAPTTPTEMLLTAAMQLVRAGPGDLARASQLMSLAVRMSKQPRLFLYACWAAIAPPEQQQECASAILALWPDRPIAMHQAAMCLRDIDPQRAVALIQRALELGLVTANSRFHLAAFARRAGDRATSIAAARASLEKDNLPDDLHTRLIDVVLREADPELARTETRAWLERAPENAAALGLAAREHAAGGDLDAALALMRRAVASQPDDPELRVYLATLLWKNQAQTAAEAMVLEVVAAAPAHVEAHRLLALIYRDRNDRAAQLAEQRRFVAERRDDPAAWHGLAKLLLDDRSPEALAEALRAATTAESLTNGKDATILEVRASAHDALGEPVSARLCRERAAALTPVGGK